MHHTADGYDAVVLLPGTETLLHTCLSYERAQDWLRCKFEGFVRSRHNYTDGWALLIDNTARRTVQHWYGSVLQIAGSLREAARDHIGDPRTFTQTQWHQALSAVGASHVILGWDPGGAYVMFTFSNQRWALADDAVGETTGLLLSRNIYCAPGLVHAASNEQDDTERFEPIYGSTLAMVANRTRVCLNNWHTNVDTDQ